MFKQEKQHLLKFIDNMKEEKNSLQAQVEHLRTSIAEEYARYLNEYGTCKLLLAKLNYMHDEQLDMCHQVQGRESGSLLIDDLENYDSNFTVMGFHQWLLSKDVKGEDVVKLTLALKIARQDLTKAQVKLNTMIADYRDVVPRRDFESLEKKYSDLLQEMKTLQKNFDQLHEEYETLLEMHRETAEERDDFCAELQLLGSGLREKSLQEVIHGGADRWGCLAEGKTSDQLVDVLLEEIGTGALKDINVFPGWGKGDKVPVYLRHEGEVKNKKLTKKDVVNILKDAWKEKIALEQQMGKRSSLPKLFLSYLQKKCGDAAAMEWSYTLYENMQLCQSNHVLSSFCDILTGEIGNLQPNAMPLPRHPWCDRQQAREASLSNTLVVQGTDVAVTDLSTLPVSQVGEEQYHSQNQLISNLQKELAACDSSNSGSLTSKQFRQEADCCPSSSAHIRCCDMLSLSALLIYQHSQGRREVNADDLKTTFCTIDPDTDDQMLDTYIGLAYQ
ncbi:hypothetical protein QYF61_002712, partial [Mycteria americana]